MVEKLVQAKMPKIVGRKKDDISEKDEFSLPQIPEEEIKRFTIDEDLTECERIKLLLTKKDAMQQSYVFLNAMNIFKSDLEMQAEIIPIICQKIQNYSEDLQVQAGLSFFDLIDRQILDEQFAEPLLEVAEEMLTQWSKQILEAWIGVYAKLLPLLAKQDAAQSEACIQRGVRVVKRMSQRNEPLSVRTSCAILIGALAVGDSLRSPEVFEAHFLAIVKDICQDFNWEVRRDICGQLMNISDYLHAQKSFEHLYPELVELIDDEEKEVAQTAILTFTDLAKLYLVEENNLEHPDQVEAVRDEMLRLLKKMLSSENFIGKVEMSRYLLEQAFKIAQIVNRPDDEELYTLLINLLQAWLPGTGNRFNGGEYERMHMAMALQNVAIHYTHRTIHLFYEPLYRDFIAQEHDSEKSLAGAKVQLAEVFHEFIKQACQSAPMEEAKQDIVGKTSREEAYASIIEQYCLFFQADQNKEVLAMALSTVPELMAVFQNPTQHNLEASATGLYEEKFKRHFMTLERYLHNNWRLHVHWLTAISTLALATEDKGEAKECVTLMLNTAKAKIASLPAKKLITEKLALMVATKENHIVRQQIHKTMMTQIAVSKTSQQRQVFLLFLEHLLPQISSAHFGQVYYEMFMAYKDEVVTQVLCQYVRLFPAARMRIADTRMADKLESILRAVQARCTKIPNSRLLQEEISNVHQIIRSSEFQIKHRTYFEEEEPIIVQREIEISNSEMEDQRQLQSLGVSSRSRANKSQISSHKGKKGAGRTGSANNFLTVQQQVSSDKRPGSQRGTSPSKGPNNMANQNKVLVGRKSVANIEDSKHKRQAYTSGGATRPPAKSQMVVSNSNEESKEPPSQGSNARIKSNRLSLKESGSSKAQKTITNITVSKM